MEGYIDAIYLWQENSTLFIVHSFIHSTKKECVDYVPGTVISPGVMVEGDEVFGLILGRRTAHSLQGFWCNDGHLCCGVGCGQGKFGKAFWRW